MRTWIALTLAATLLGQEKTYDLELDSLPVKGRKIEVTKRDSSKMVIMVNGRVASVTEYFIDFTATEEVLTVDGDRLKRRWTFTKAMHKSGGKIVPYSFQGKSVVVTKAREREPFFDVEGGGDLSSDDIDGLKSFGDIRHEGRASPPDLLGPDKPVKAGETWTKDAGKIIRALFDRATVMSIDTARSKVSFTLKSVEQRGGVEYGKLTGVMEFLFVAIGPMKLDQPFSMKTTIDVEACIDGKVPDGVAKLKGGMKGRSPVTGKPESDVEVDFTTESSRNVKTLK